MLAGHVPDGPHDTGRGVADQAEDQCVLAGVVGGGRGDVEREAAGEARDGTGRRAGGDRDRGDEQEHQVRRGRAGERQPVHHGELDDDGGEEGNGEDDGGERLAGDRDLLCHLLTTTPMTPRPVKSANGLTSAVGVSEPGWVVTADTVPTGTPGT